MLVGQGAGQRNRGSVPRCHLSAAVLTSARRGKAIHLVSTTVEVADILTKALPKDDPRFKKFRDILMNITD